MSSSSPLLCLVVLTALVLGPGDASALPECTIRLATTTSTENSGLLEHLRGPFETSSGCRLHVISVGTGKALRLGERGDVDVLLVHARDAELAFVAAGHGVDRREVMYNDFVIVGPPADGARLSALVDAAEALRRVAASGSGFVSRGDDSGTHRRELGLWGASGVAPAGPWYLEVGQGMGRTLQVASELGAYTLTDRGTWIAHEERLELALLVEGDRALHNPYGIVAVNPRRHPEVNAAGATKLIEWITSATGQALIAGYRVRGEALFHPLAAAPGP